MRSFLPVWIDMQGVLGIEFVAVNLYLDRRFRREFATEHGGHTGQARSGLPGTAGQGGQSCNIG